MGRIDTFRSPLAFEEWIMRNLVWVALAAAVLLGGYVLFTGKSVTEVVGGATDTATGIEAPAALEDAGAAVGAATEQAADAVKEAATDATEAVTDAAAAVEAGTEAAVEAVSEAAGDAATAASDAAADAAAAAADTASDAAAAAVEAVTETATDAANAAAEAVDPAATTATTDAAPVAAPAPEVGASVPEVAAGAKELPEALTVAGFDMDKVTQLIKDAGMGEMQKSLLIAGIRAAQDNPDLLKPALEAAQKALGY